MCRYVKKKCEDRFTDCKHTNYFETFFLLISTDCKNI